MKMSDADQKITCRNLGQLATSIGDPWARGVTMNALALIEQLQANVIRLERQVPIYPSSERTEGFCGDPYGHDCGRIDCPTSDSFGGGACGLFKPDKFRYRTELKAAVKNLPPATTIAGLIAAGYLRPIEPSKSITPEEFVQLIERFQRLLAQCQEKLHPHKDAVLWGQVCEALK